MKHKVQIQWSEDTHECDTCGCSWATGAVVTVDGRVVMNKPALASCWNSIDVDVVDVYKAIIEHLGCEVTETYANDNGKLT